MRTCVEFISFISDYLDGDVAAHETRAVEVHLQQCQFCRSVYLTLKTTVEVCRQAPLAEFTSEIHDWLHATLREMWKAMLTD
jgi:predicted anti-sigma-YlaC factor YlaD